MKQTGLIPSGLQTWHRCLVASSPTSFLYSSTLSTCRYVLGDEWRLAAVDTSHERTITSVALAPGNVQAEYVTSSVDNSLHIISSASPPTICTLPILPLHLEPSRADVLAVQHKQGVGFFDCVRQTFVQEPELKIEGVSCIKFNSDASLLAVGAQSSIIIYSMSSRKITGRVTLNSPVLELGWDALSTTYFAASSSGGALALIDAESSLVVQHFDSCASDIHSIVWSGRPGEIITASKDSSVLTVWQAASNKSHTKIKLQTPEGNDKKSGILCIQSLSHQSDHYSLLLGYTDGCVAVYDSRCNTRLQFITTAAHSETVFGLAFQPSCSSRFATASYDGSIRVWSSDTLTCERDYTHRDGILYSLSFCPNDDARLAFADSQGTVTVWDSVSGQVLTQVKQHSKPVYSVKWCAADKELIASASSDGYVLLFTPAGKLIKKFKHPAAVYGVDFSPANKNIIATACHDGVLRIFDASSQNTKATHEFSGHSARVFNAAWSPLLHDRIATASDDKTVRVWNINSPSDVVVLSGHTHNVRALLWHAEVPWLLFSGSWDGTIRMWDIRSGKCLDTITDHHADVYGLAAHPDRPFSIVSTSRDTSIRLWQLDDTVGLKFKIQAIIENGLLQPSHVDNVTSAMKPTSGARLCGAASLNLIKNNKDAKDIDRYSRLFQYFTNVPGVKQLWQLVDVLVTNAAADPNTQHPHMNDMRAQALAAIKSKQNAKVFTVGSGSRRDKLTKAAEGYIKLGMIREYCEILVELDQWERAIAVAPALSINYWKNLTTRYALHLRDKGDSTCVPFFIAAGEINTLINYQIQTRQLTDAFLIAVCDSIGTLPQLPPFEDMAPPSSSSIGRDNLPISPQMKNIADVQSYAHFVRGQPVLAAVELLKTGDAMAAVQRLMIGNEVLLAVALCKVLKLQFVDFVFRAASQICEQLGMWDDALKCLHHLRDPTNDIILMAARYNGPINKKIDFYQKCGIRSMEAFISSVDQALKEHKHAEALTFLVAGGQSERALSLGLDYLRDMLSTGAWSLEEVQSLLQPLNCINLASVPAELRTQFLAYSYYIASQVAVVRGYSTIVPWLFETVNSFISKLPPTANFPITPQLLKLNEASFYAPIDSNRAQQLLKELLAESNLNNKYKTAANALKKQVDTGASVIAANASNRRAINKNCIVSLGSTLPSGGVPSIISHSSHGGAKFTLDDGSVVTYNEALMLSRCTPFSPSGSGNKIHVWAKYGKDSGLF